MSSPVNISRLTNYLNDSVKSSGDIIQFGLNNTVIFENLIRCGLRSSRSVYGYDKSDTVTQDYIRGKLRNQTEKGKWEISTLDTIKFKCNEICFAFLDIVDPNEINTILETIWPKMSYGSTLFFSSYNAKRGVAVDNHIKRFLLKHDSDIVAARQMVIGGTKEHTFVLKCFNRTKKPEITLANDEVTIATVFKTGGDYTVAYVNHIANSVKEHVTVPYKFVCLTDCTSGFNSNVHIIIPFKNNYPRWWGKIELFEPNKFNTERVFYLDLDTIIVNNIDDIVRYNGHFFGLRDFYHQYGLGSGLMCWRQNDPIMHQIYEKFMESPTAHMNNCRFGDQEFIMSILPKYNEYVQDIYPNRIVSYKKDCVKNGIVSIPEKSSIICFHGPPRPHHVNDPVIRKYWRG